MPLMICMEDVFPQLTIPSLSATQILQAALELGRTSSFSSGQYVDMH